MRKIVSAAALILLAGATAGATYYLDERFEGANFPPSGWSTANNGYGSWSSGTGGPAGKPASPRRGPGDDLL